MNRPGLFIKNKNDSIEDNNRKINFYHNTLDKWKRDMIYSAYFGISKNDISYAENIIRNIIGPMRNVNLSDLEHDKFTIEFFDRVERAANNESKKRIIKRTINNWFKIVVSLFLSGVLFLGWGYVQAQKDIALNGRYASAPSFYGYSIIDTRTGDSYRINGELLKKFEVKK